MLKFQVSNTLYFLVLTVYLLLYTFRNVYVNGSGICSKLWGQSFIYSQYSLNDSDRQCLVPHWPVGSPSPNTVALENMKLTGSAAIHLSSVVGYIVGAIAVLTL